MKRQNVNFGLSGLQTYLWLGKSLHLQPDCTYVLLAIKMGDNILLLTNCEVDTRKYSDRSFEVRTEHCEVRTKN